MRRSQSLGALMLAGALLPVSAGVVVGQDEVGRHVTGTMMCGDAGSRLMLEDSAVQLDLWPSRCQLMLSDPRVSGAMESDTHMACFLYDADRTCLLRGASTLTGPDGAWVGTWYAMNDASNMQLPTFGTMQGTGEYEGWTFWLYDPDALDPSSEVAGTIYEGPPPPWSESLPLTPAE